MEEPRAELEDVIIHVNQVAFDDTAPKFAVIETAEPLRDPKRFRITNEAGTTTVFESSLGDDQPCEEWIPGRHLYRADFSTIRNPGKHCLLVNQTGKTWRSLPFEIGPRTLATKAIPAIIGFYNHQRANTPAELEADSHVLLYGSTNRIDMRGGWCDASGDISKYLSHLAYTNFMSPQQTPLVVWSMVNTVETAGPLLEKLDAGDALRDEALVRRGLPAARAFAGWLFPHDCFQLFQTGSGSPPRRRAAGGQQDILRLPMRDSRRRRYGDRRAGTHLAMDAGHRES